MRGPIDKICACEAVAVAMMAMAAIANVLIAFICIYFYVLPYVAGSGAAPSVAFFYDKVNIFVASSQILRYFY